MARKAVILAAGLGTRLRPLTCAVPKPLLPVWGEPILSRIVRMVRGWGVEEITVNAHYHSDQVASWCAQNDCRVSVEPEILGTGGVLNPLREWIQKDDFYLVNADIVVEGIDAEPFPKDPFAPRVKGTETIGACLLTEEGPRTVEASPEGDLVTCWKSADAGWDGTYTYCGVALLKAEILDFVAPTGFSTIIEAYEKAMMAGKFIRGVKPKSLRWSDAGTVESYIALNETADANAFADIPQLKAAFVGTPEKISFLGARGSNRCFFRAGDQIAILYDDEKRAENARYASHARYLAKKGIPVPKVLRDFPSLKTLVLAFAGSVDLKARAATPGVGVIASYSPVVEALAKLNALAAAPDLPELEPPFSPDLWTWERNLFKEQCLGARYKRTLPEAAEKELLAVAARLDREPQALVHRDFQSTNILWKNDAFSFIDFQGMRLGPAAYDLASLLYDPYVKLSESERRALAALYGQAAGRPDIPDVLPFAAVQRLVQALGAYGRLKSVGQPQFEKHILPALENLLAAADEAGLDAVGALAEDLIACERRF